MSVVLDFEKLSERLKSSLPGSRAHEQLRAESAYLTKFRFKFDTPPRTGGVLLLLYPHDDKILFPLIKRQEYPGMHSGQVSFPGGKKEGVETPIETALREANEEIGVDPKTIQVLGELSIFNVIPSNFIVTPVIGITTQRPKFIPDPREVAKVIEGNLDDLMKADAIRSKEIEVGAYKMQAPYFEFMGEMVWGATAMMLNEFRTILEEIV